MNILLPYFKPTAELSVLLRLMQHETALPENVDQQRLTAMIRKNGLEPLAAERLSGYELPDDTGDASVIITMQQISVLGRLAKLLTEH